MHLSPSVQSVIRQKLSTHLQLKNELTFRPIGGGSINETYCIEFSAQRIFCKINSATKFPQLFAREKDGLALLAKPKIIKVASVIDCFETDDTQILFMEWIEAGERTESFWKLFGEQLANLHQQTETYFGLTEDNYMGSVLQSNLQKQTWTSFFQQERLEPMVDLCYQKQLLTSNHLKQFDALYLRLHEIFVPEPPSLLHGDLWSGNFMCNQKNQPVLIDPAVYFGHRSMDLAMTTLFGGFRQPFYEAYHHHFPLPKNYEQQWAVCNIYPLLIHLYLFGGSYRPQIEKTLKAFA